MTAEHGTEVSIVSSASASMIRDSTTTGESLEPCWSASPTRFEMTCASRSGSQALVSSPKMVVPNEIALIGCPRSVAARLRVAAVRGGQLRSVARLRSRARSVGDRLRADGSRAARARSAPRTRRSRSASWELTARGRCRAGARSPTRSRARGSRAAAGAHSPVPWSRSRHRPRTAPRTSCNRYGAPA